MKKPRTNRVPLTTPRAALLAALLAAAAGCGGGTPSPTKCSVQVLGLEQLKQSDKGIDVAYTVGGTAGSPGQTWLVARVGSDKYIPGQGVNVGPGPFKAVVDLKLTGMPTGFLVLLEVAGKRCQADAPLPNK